MLLGLGPVLGPVLAPVLVLELELGLAPEPEPEPVLVPEPEPEHALEPDVSTMVLKHPYGHCLEADTLVAPPWQQLLQPSSSSQRWLPSV